MQCDWWHFQASKPIHPSCANMRTHRSMWTQLACKQAPCAYCYCSMHCLHLHASMCQPTSLDVLSASITTDPAGKHCPHAFCEGSSGCLTRQAPQHVQALGCGAKEHEAAIARLQAERRQLGKANKALLEELARAAGQALSAHLPAQVAPRPLKHQTLPAGKTRLVEGEQA